MDDLANKLKQLLHSEEGKAQLKNIAEALGASNTQSDSSSPEKTDGASGGIDMSSLVSLLSGLGKGSDDKNLQLIKAIRPHLSEQRQTKADDALKIMKLLPLLPLLKENGLLGDIL